MRSSRGFSLVELLVILAVVAIGLALALPALAQARHASKTSVCLLRHHAVFTALASYAAEHDGWLPPYDLGVIRPCRYDAPAALGKLALPAQAYADPGRDDALWPRFSAIQTAWWRYAIGDAGKLWEPFTGVTSRGAGGAQEHHLPYQFTAATPLLLDATYWPERDGQAIPLHGGRGMTVTFGDGHGEFQAVGALWYVKN